jgi:ribosomal protein L36
MGISVRLSSRLVIKRRTKVLVLNKTKPVINQYFARVITTEED